MGLLRSSQRVGSGSSSFRPRPPAWRATRQRCFCFALVQRTGFAQRTHYSFRARSNLVSASSRLSVRRRLSRVGNRDGADQLRISEQNFCFLNSRLTVRLPGCIRLMSRSDREVRRFHRRRGAGCDGPVATAGLSCRVELVGNTLQGCERMMTRGRGGRPEDPAMRRDTKHSVKAPRAWRRWELQADKIVACGTQAFSCFCGRLP